MLSSLQTRDSQWRTPGSSPPFANSRASCIMGNRSFMNCSTSQMPAPRAPLRSWLEPPAPWSRRATMQTPGRPCASNMTVSSYFATPSVQPSGISWSTTFAMAMASEARLACSRSWLAASVPKSLFTNSMAFCTPFSHCGSTSAQAAISPIARSNSLSAWLVLSASRAARGMWTWKMQARPTAKRSPSQSCWPSSPTMLPFTRTRPESRGRTRRDSLSSLEMAQTSAPTPRPASLTRQRSASEPMLVSPTGR
mmetsp:Transcript_62567/g.201768  ORF Transcript_62567/g.201768 Transcript_62567/m.201768 type:complete len:252 (+) Transcript_62567:571-1326(+)